MRQKSMIDYPTGSNMENISLEKDKLESLYEHTIALSRYARARQKNIKREFKSDGSVLTETDLYISKEISKMIKKLFPFANVISEEEESEFNPESPYTFILDPIDGTDVYSQGMPSFATALGILDKDRNPVGAIICAPRFGIGEEELSIRLFPGEECFINSEILVSGEKDDEIRQIMMTSHDIARYDFSAFDGKIRTIGSSILHIISPVIFPQIDAAITQPCYAWDIAASHAVLRHYGMDIFYSDGTGLEYSDEMLIGRKKCRGTTYSSTREKAYHLMRLVPFRP